MKKFSPESLNDEYYRARNQSSVFVWKRAEKLYSLSNKPQVGFQKGLFKEIKGLFKDVKGLFK